MTDFFCTAGFGLQAFSMKAEKNNQCVSARIFRWENSGNEHKDKARLADFIGERAKFCLKVLGQFCARLDLRNKSAIKRYCCSGNNEFLRGTFFFAMKRKYPLCP